jgi:hypothetical protein
MSKKKTLNDMLKETYSGKVAAMYSSSTGQLLSGVKRDFQNGSQINVPVPIVDYELWSTEDLQEFLDHYGEGIVEPEVKKILKKRNSPLWRLLND